MTNNFIFKHYVYTLNVKTASVDLYVVDPSGLDPEQMPYKQCLRGKSINVNTYDLYNIYF